MLSIDVSTLAAELEPSPLGTWLAQVLGDDWEISAESTLNDCGEQDGTSVRDDFPLCVAVHVARGAETGFLQFGVGTYKSGVVGPPRFYWGMLNGNNLNALPDLVNLTGEPKSP